jgi:ribosome maturation protein SDO1
MSYDEIVKLILEKGEIQVSEKERNLNISNIKNDIANIIVEKTFNKENGLPFPHNVILKVLDDIKFQMRDSEDAKKQALKAIKLIQENDILPIERNLMQIFVKLKNQNMEENAFQEFVKQFITFINENNAQIIDINTFNAKIFNIKCNILPNHYRDLLTKYNDGKFVLI